MMDPDSPTDSTTTQWIAEQVASNVLQWFASTKACEKKLQPQEWTVLAGFVVQQQAVASECSTSYGWTPGAATSNDLFRVVACATGTKCVGRKELSEDGWVLHDCHAEVLARRALLRYLHGELRWHLHQQKQQSKQLANKNEPGIANVHDMSLLEWHPASGRYRLRHDIKLHLFVSEMPCGDASIYELQPSVVQEFVHKRLKPREEDQIDGGTKSKKHKVEQDHQPVTQLRLTGAKELSSADSRELPQLLQHQEHQQHQRTPAEKSWNQRVATLRRKSGRSDLPLDQQTFSMSCSDKLAKWIALGLQGTALSAVVDPIPLSSVVVCEDTTALSPQVQLKALGRALRDRLRMPGLAWNPCELLLTKQQFPRKKSSMQSVRGKVVPAGIAFHWNVVEKKWRQSYGACCDGENHQSRNLIAQSLLEPSMEVLIGTKGLKHGSNISKANASYERMASRVCKRRLFELIRSLVDANDRWASYKSATSLLSFKQRVWKSDLRVAEQRKQLFESSEFEDWQRVPDAYQSFTISSSQDQDDR